MHGRNACQRGTLVALLCAGILLAGTASASAATFIVDDDGLADVGLGCDFPTPVNSVDSFASIQAAVNASIDGDTIKVCPGVYDESVNVFKAVTLQGAQAGAPGNNGTRPGTAATESIVDGAVSSGTRITPFVISTSDVTIDGFVIRDQTSVSQFGAGIYADGGTTGVEIQNNVVANNIAGIFLGSSNSTIQRNLFLANNQPGPASGTAIYSDQFITSGPQTNVAIVDNRFSGNADSGILFGSTDATKPASNITMSNNDFDGNGRALVAFALIGATFSGNEVSGATASSADVRLFEGVSGVSVTENTLTGNSSTASQRGMQISNLGTGLSPAQAVSFSCNSITSHTGAGLEIDSGAYSGAAGSLIAEHDWWDSSTGPTIASNPGGTGEEIVDASSQVDYTPFQTAAIDTDPSANGFQCDQTRPSVTINQASTQSDPQGGPPSSTAIDFDVTFSEPVTGFDASDVVLSGTAGATVATVSGSGDTYTVRAEGMTSSGTVTASIPAGAAADASGNQSTASTSTDNTVTYDRPPGVTMSSAAPNPTDTSPIPVTVTFDESVTGFTAGDVVASNGSVSNFSGSGASYSFDLTPAGQGTVTADIPSGVAQDSFPQGNFAAPQFSRTYDLLPTVTINQAAGQSDPTIDTSIEFDVKFSESVTGFTDSDVSPAGTSSPTTASVSGSGDTYTVSLSGMTSNGTVVASLPAGAAQDGNGNSTPASTSTDNQVTWEQATPPTVNLLSLAPNPTNTAPITVEADFSEDVTGFTASDVVAGNSSVSNFSGSGSAYTFDLTPAGQGAVTADVPAGAAQDNLGAGNSPAAQLSRTFDSVGPTVTINQASGQADPTSDSPIKFTVAFSQSVSGFTASDVSLSGSAGATTATVSGSGASYTVSVTGMTADGDVRASVPAGAVQDAAGNASAASTSSDNTVTYQVPRAPAGEPEQRPADADGDGIADARDNCRTTPSTDQRDLDGDGIGHPCDDADFAPGSCANPQRGTDGNDTLTGSLAGDTLLGLGGADTLTGAGDADCLQGGDGADRLDGGDGPDRMRGDAGNDRLSGGGGNDLWMRGGAGNDRLSGGADRDNLSGGDGDDSLNGGSGRDVLNGGAGDDRLSDSAGPNRFSGRSGDDTINAANGERDSVSCGTGDDVAIVDPDDRVSGCETARVRR